MKFALILLCAGRGRRLSASCDKAFVTLGRYPMFFYSYRVFASFKEIAPLVIVARKKYFSLIRRHAGDSRVVLVEGGKERKDSVWNGLSFLRDDPSRYVIIHDGARPFVPREMVLALMRAAEKYKAAAPVLPVDEALKKVKGGRIERTVSRDGLYTVQTPQVFEKELITAVHLRLRRKRTVPIYDDTQLLERVKVPVRAVAGSVFNIKVTRPPDMVLARSLLAVGVNQGG